MNKEIRDIVRQGESQNLEFKTGTASAKILAQQVCAFANSGGGLIAVGIGDDGAVIGTKASSETINKLKTEIPSLISPAISVSVTPIEAEGKTIILIDVPESYDRPYTCDGKVFVRSGARTAAADGAAIRDVLASSRGKESRWERQPVPGMGQEEIDESELLGMRNTLVQSGMLGDRVTNATAYPEMLEILNLVESGRYLNSALALFGKHPTKRYPQMRVRAVFYGDEAGDKLTDNRIVEGHCFKILSELIGFLHRHVNISSEIPSEGLQRDEGPVYPSIAIREALMNAIMHRDYESFDGGMSVSIYPGRIEIWNSGILPSGMTIGDLKKPHYSRPHNPDIAHAFFLRGYVERIGSGIKRIMNAFAEQGLPEPVWSVNSGGICLILTATSSLPDLNSRQRAFVEKTTKGQRVALADYIRVIAEKISDRSARSDLSDLAAKGYVRKRGSARATEYERTQKGHT